jgi:hypothetical protein
VAEPAFVGAARTWLIRPGEAGFPYRESSNIGIGNSAEYKPRAGFLEFEPSLIQTSRSSRA